MQTRNLDPKIRPPNSIASQFNIYGDFFDSIDPTENSRRDQNDSGNDLILRQATRTPTACHSRSRST